MTVAFVVVVVLMGLTPKGGKPVERTRLMKAARHVLLAGVIVCGAAGLWGFLRR